MKNKYKPLVSQFLVSYLICSPSSLDSGIGVHVGDQAMILPSIVSSEQAKRSDSEPDSETSELPKDLLVLLKRKRFSIWLLRRFGLVFCLFVVFVLFLGVDFLQKPIIEVSHYHKNPKLR